MTWITCQLGAREHYAIPCALHQTESLYALITDAWVKPNSPFHLLPGKITRSLCDRYHPDLKNVSVKSFTSSLLPLEAYLKLSKTTGWFATVARNQWFQDQALSQLKALSTQFNTGKQPTLFSYSYTALKLLRYAKQQGWHTVLGQIDPGLNEEKQVSQLQVTYGQHYQSTWTPAPPNYWDDWRQECQLADQIVVNSTWSQTALIKEGIPLENICVVPLAYQAPREATTFTRQYPSVFTNSRPLRVLFLGQIILRKGIAAIIEALPYLEQTPIEIWLVGSTELNLSAVLHQYPQLKWIGQVPRSEVRRYYQQADVFLFPTHSDGFGLTQLEAQAWQLPIIASQYCGKVVSHQQNGLILPQVSGRAIADALLTCCDYPERLQQWAKQSVDIAAYNLENLAQRLQDLVHASL